MDALKNIMDRLIGEHQKFVTVYPMTYCRKHIDVIIKIRTSVADR